MTSSVKGPRDPSVRPLFPGTGQEVSVVLGLSVKVGEGGEGRGKMSPHLAAQLQPTLTVRFLIEAGARARSPPGLVSVTPSRYITCIAVFIWRHLNLYPPQSSLGFWQKISVMVSANIGQLLGSRTARPDTHLVFCQAGHFSWQSRSRQKLPQCEAAEWKLTSAGKYID